MSIFVKFRVLIVGMALMLSTSSCASSGSFEFMITKPFFFNQVGNSAEFVVDVSDARDYELALETQQKVFPLKVGEAQPFQWELEVTVWHDDELLDKQVLGKLVAGWPLGDEFDYFSQVSLGIIPALKSRFSSKTFVVKVLVKHIDERYTDEKLPIRVGIRPSPLI